MATPNQKTYPSTWKVLNGKYIIQGKILINATNGDAEFFSVDTKIFTSNKSNNYKLETEKNVLTDLYEQIKLNPSLLKRGSITDFEKDFKNSTEFADYGLKLETYDGKNPIDNERKQFFIKNAPSAGRSLNVPGLAAAQTPDPTQDPDSSPVIDLSGASLTGIGTSKLESYFPSGVKTLRYPRDIIDSSTDYLQISIAKYDRGFASDKAAKLIRATNDAKFKFKEGSKGNIGTIILPIPSNIQDGNSVGYSDGTLDSLTGAVVGGVLKTIQTDFSGKSIQKGLEEAGRKIGTTFNAAVDSGVKGQVLRSLAVQAASSIPGAGNVTPEQLLTRQTGGILNPNMELLFNGVTLRSFKFSFKLTPRSEKEANEIKEIIKTLKINMAPQTLTNDNFLRTPNVFELQYMTGPQPHAFLHRFKTCALTDMSVNYTGEGIYATYSDATPNSMIMDLTFKELEPIYNTDYEGVGGVGY